MNRFNALTTFLPQAKQRQVVKKIAESVNLHCALNGITALSMVVDSLYLDSRKQQLNPMAVAYTDPVSRYRCIERICGLVGESVFVGILEAAIDQCV